MKKIRLGEYIEELVDIGSNGSDEQISKNLNMKDTPDYAYMIRTVNLNNNNFKTNLKYITKESYEYFKKSKMFGGEIIINKIGCPGTVGLMPYLDKPISLGLNQYAIRFKEVINQKFMYYKLKSIEPYLKSIAHGTTTKTITKEEIKNIELDIPDRNTQNKIEYILTAIDNKIKINLDINNNLEEMMKLLYQRYFLEFNFPNEDGKPYKLYGGKMAWNEKLKREIPVNWEDVKVKDLCDVISGYPFSKDTYSKEGKYKLITIKNVQDDGINLTTDNNINDIPDNLPSYCMLKPINILMSLTGNVGRVGIMYANNCLLNQRVAILKEKSNKQIPFIYSFFKNEHTKKLLENMSTGTSQLNLSPIETEKLSIAFNNDIINKYGEITYPYILKIEMLLEENQNLIELRDYLLPMLMNGQISVDDVEI